ncbi:MULTISPECIES: helix-turn-helix transcriptional regulator [Haloarcula]|nr:MULTISPECIES: helix-turn-helix transcriptional regulator [Halomicroarcula]MBX0347007.1 helix-turn-helix transcriptional regulator [Halomicroarcula pellucida]MDS0277118.1 helix-turn-helix transcriptional regulator [Halomicroarcula sp. S1AR25-4]
MAKWFQSGRRRDMCVILAGAEDGELTGQRLKTRLERRYDARIEPKSFYGALEAMADAGFVQHRTDGIADKYSLTEGGERRLREHYAWMGENLGDADGEQ